MLVAIWGHKLEDRGKCFHRGTGWLLDKILLWIVSNPQWNLYVSIKPTLTMPGMNRVHEHLAWFRKLLLRHKCGTGTYGEGVHRDEYTNVQHDIQNVCKNCDFKRSHPSDSHDCDFQFCDEDFMPYNFRETLSDDSS